MDDNRRDNEQLVAQAFHQMRSEAKKKRKDVPKGEPMHHRAATDWWNFVDR